MVARDPEELAMGVWSIVHGAAELQNAGQLFQKKLTPLELANLVTSVVARGFLKRD